MRSIQDCSRVSLNLETSSTGIHHLSRLPDCISWRSLIRCPSELRCLTRLKNVPIRCEAWVSWRSTPAARSIVLDRSIFSVPVPVLCGSAVCHPPRSPDPVKTAKFHSRVKFLSNFRIHDESDPIDPTQKHKFPFPDPRRVRSHRSDSPVQFQPRIKFLSRVKFLSSSRIHDESDPIDPTHQSSSCQGSSSCQVPGSTTSPIPSIRLTSPVLVKGQVPVKFPDPRRVRSHRSDSET